jgi:hypothetical protein
VIPVDSESRKATGTWRCTDAAGSVTTGEAAPLLIGDDSLSAGPRSAAYLDADQLAVVDRTIELTLHPSGRLAVSMLGRRHDTFAATLREAWLARRVAGMLAHGIEAPTRFRGVVVAPTPVGADLLLFTTHLTVAPDQGDPWQIPIGAITSVRHDANNWTIDIGAYDQVFRFGQLGRQTEAFALAVNDGVKKSRATLGAEDESPLFSDGVGVPASSLPAFTSLVERWASPERLEGAKAIAARAADPRIGLVTIVDTDGDMFAASDPLPDNVAAFLLAPLGSRVVMEIISGPSAATYVFDGHVDAMNRDLQQLHFRRRPLQLSDSELASPASDYRLAARRLDPLRRLRAATRDRFVHDAGHAEKIATLN